MFGFLKRTPKKETKRPAKRSKPRKTQQTHQTPQTGQTMPRMTYDPNYDMMKKISDLQDQISRHDSKMHDKIDDHHNFMLSQHHEPMKKAAIEIMNKLYNQPAPVREEVFRIIKTDEDILSTIGDNKMSAGDVAERLGFTREHISRRVSILTKNGLLTKMQEGKRIFYAKPENM